METVTVEHFGVRLRLRPPGTHRDIPHWYIDGAGGQSQPRIRTSSYTADLQKAKRVAFHLAAGNPIREATRLAEQDLFAFNYPLSQLDICNRLEAIVLLAQGGPANLPRIAELAEEVLAAVEKIET